MVNIVPTITLGNQPLSYGDLTRLILDETTVLVRLTFATGSVPVLGRVSVAGVMEGTVSKFDPEHNSVILRYDRTYKVTQRAKSNSNLSPGRPICLDCLEKIEVLAIVSGVHSFIQYKGMEIHKKQPADFNWMYLFLFMERVHDAKLEDGTVISLLPNESTLLKDQVILMNGVPVRYDDENARKEYESSRKGIISFTIKLENGKKIKMMPERTRFIY